jgi:hypothetical protein
MYGMTRRRFMERISQSKSKITDVTPDAIFVIPCPRGGKHGIDYGKQNKKA